MVERSRAEFSEPQSPTGAIAAVGYRCSYSPTAIVTKKISNKTMFLYLRLLATATESVWAGLQTHDADKNSIGIKAR